MNKSQLAILISLLKKVLSLPVKNKIQKEFMELLISRRLTYSQMEAYFKNPLFFENIPLENKFKEISRIRLDPEDWKRLTLDPAERTGISKEDITTRIRLDDDWKKKIGLDKDWNDYLPNKNTKKLR